MREEVISELQGACRSGQSCIHTAFSLQETIAASLEDSNKCFVAFYDVAKAFDTVWIDGLFRQMHDIGVRGKTWRLLYRCYLDFRCCVRIEGEVSEWYTLACGIHQGGFLSLIKYTVFINSLLTELRNSNLCCKIYRIPSTPVGYADDLATCCKTKVSTDRSMEIVYRHGCTWRYEFNAKKSGVLVYGEGPRENERNSRERVFRLGQARVRERTEYDHVGVKAHIFPGCVTGIKERIAKARKSLNAVSGLGIRKCGLNMATCNVIFWSLVVPTALFGSELWRLDGDAIALLEEFQQYAGKRIQRFYSRIPNVCSFFALGWVRLERVVQAKKMLFIRSILVLDNQILPRKIFCERAARYFDRPEDHDLDPVWSLVLDLLNTAVELDLIDSVRGMVTGGHVLSKAAWKTVVWSRVWELENVYWRIQTQLHRNLDLLTRIVDEPRYLSWWWLSDRHPNMMRQCETMAKLVCHASMLRSDDVRLKGLNRSYRQCPLCDLAALDDAYHLLLQCLALQLERNQLFLTITNIPDGTGNIAIEAEDDTLALLLGKAVLVLDLHQLEGLWVLIANCVSNMYRRNLTLKEGIG